jgi:hypothetical protein
VEENGAKKIVLLVNKGQTHTISVDGIRLKIDVFAKLDNIERSYDMKSNLGVGQWILLGILFLLFFPFSLILLIVLACIKTIKK